MRRRKSAGAALAAALACLVCAPLAARAQPSTDPFAVFDRVLPSVVRITVEGVAEDNTPVSQTGTGVFVSSAGHILTAFHVVGKDRPGGRVVVWKQTGNPARPNPRIGIELWTPNGVLAPANAPTVLIDSRPNFDLALLRLAGTGRPAAACRAERLAEGAQVRGIGWRAGTVSYDPIIGLIYPADLSLGERYRIAALSQPGNSGAPVFDADGRVVAILTSGRDGRVAPVGETYAMPIEWALDMLPRASECRVSVDNGDRPDGPPPPSGDRRAMVEACIHAELDRIRSEHVPFSASGGARSAGGGAAGRSDYDEATVRYAAPPGYEIVSPVAVRVTDGNGQGGVDNPEYETDSLQRIVAVSVKVWSRSPAQLFGPGSWRAVSLEGVVRRVADADLLSQARGTCQARITAN